MTILGAEPAHRDGAVRFATSKDGTRIAFDVTGSGPAIVLLHGGGQTRKVWHDAGYSLRLAEEFMVICVDLRGSGDSDKPTSVAAYATDRVVEDVLAVADAAAAPSFSLWGFSYGANVGRYVAIASKRVASMVYIGIPFGPAATGVFRDTIVGLRAKWAPILEAAAAGTLDVASLSEADRKAWDSGVAPLRIAWLSAMLDYAAIEPGDMPCRTLWIVGTENKDTMASVAAYKDRLSNTRVSLVLLDGLNHAQELDTIERTLPPSLEFARGTK